MKYSVGACGGTFDHFHKGHKAFLQKALTYCHRLIIGITTDEFICDKQYLPLESFQKRIASVNNFLKKENLTKHVDIVLIHDIYGPTIEKDFPCDVLIVSKNTKKGAMHINDERKKRKFHQLPIVICPLLYARDGSIISSTNIRAGIMNREGVLYLPDEFCKKTWYLPTKLRRQLKQQFGKIVTTKEEFISEALPLSPSDRLLITVGDIVAKTLISFHIYPQIAVIDYNVERKKKFSSYREHGFMENESIIIVANPSGTLTTSLLQTIKNISYDIDPQENTIIKVDGEEDLATLPLLLAAPLGSIIVYGQPGKGMAVVEITETIKEKGYRIVHEFKTTRS